jgi:hypothetical protein
MDAIRSGSPRLGAAPSVRLGTIAFLEGRYGEAREFYDRGVALLRDAGDRRGEAVALANFGMFLYNDGRVAEAEQSLRRALTLHQETGDRVRESIARMELGLCAIETKSLLEARDVFEHALSLHREVRNSRWEAFTLIELAHLADDEGRFDEGERHFAKVVAIAPSLFDPYLDAHVAATRGMMQARRGRAADARAAFDEGLARSKSPWRPGILDAGGLVDAFVELAHAIAAASVEEASHHIARAREHLRGVDETHGAHTGSGRVALARLHRAIDVLVARKHAPPNRTHDALPPSASLEVSADGAWFRAADGRRVSLVRRAPLKRILVTLLERRLENPPAGLRAADVLEAGWPGERVSHDAAAQRVRNAIYTLRKLGLGYALRTDDDGYALDPRVAVKCARQRGR